MEIRILIVEDEALIAEELRGRLSNLGYKVVGVTHSGEDAIELTRTEAPNIVLMDIQLHGKMDGIQAAEEIRNELHIPVIFVTAYADDETLKRAKVTQPFGYLLKPFDTYELRSSIEMALYKNDIEAALRKSESMYRNLVELSSDAVLVTDLRGLITDAFHQTAKWFGYTDSKELIGVNGFELIAPEDRERAQLSLEKTLKEDWTRDVELTLMRKDGTFFIGEINSTVIRNDRQEPEGFLVIAKDISSRKNAEHALKESEERYRNLFEQSVLGIYRTTPDGEIIMANRALINMLGYQSLDDIKSRNLEQEGFVNSDDRAIFKQKINQEGRIIGHETSWVKKDGSALHVRENARAVCNKDGDFIYFEGTIEDVTLRKRSEEMLRSERDKFSSMLSALGEGVLIVNRAYQMEYQNEVFKEHFGERLNQKCYTICTEEQHPPEMCLLDEALKTGEIQHLETEMPNGRFYDKTYSSFTDVDGNKKVLILLRDITERKQLQAEATHAAHLASLGELAAGVAHEINNPIAGIINCAEILIEKCHALNQDKSVPEMILKQGDRVAEIVSNLLSFARPQKEVHVPTKIKDVIHDALGLTEVQLNRDNIHLETHVPNDLPLIQADGTQIQQVFINILSNARYALNDKYSNPDENKRLSIKVKAYTNQNSEMIQIIFHDHGTGISPDLLDRLCDPFFSTKPKGEGTGLGLSISYGIVKDHGGTLRFETQEGEFTKVIVELPVRRSR